MVYSKYELAIEKAREHVEKEERDLYLCMVRYPSGIEFVLKPNLTPGFSCLECIKLSFHHHFKSRDNAIREANRFEREMGKNIIIDRKAVVENGYNKTLYFQLCST